MSKVALLITVVATAVATLFSAASADEGFATYYTAPYTPSSCNGFQDDGTMIAAASEEIWNNRGACNQRYRVECTGGTNQGVPEPCRGGSIEVTVVDYCPPPHCRGTIDLSKEAFAMIADPAAGKIQISYTLL